MQTISIFDEYITLGQVLKELGLIETGGQAKRFLAEHEGEIFYNGEAENRRGKKLYAGDLLEIPSFDLQVTFEAASPEEIAEKAEIKALEKAANQKNHHDGTPKKSNSQKPKSPFNKK